MEPDDDWGRGVRIVVQHDDGSEQDITTGVQIAYDCVIHSMDWGSGFLDTEEVDAIVKLAENCRFPNFEELFNKVQDDRRRQEDAARRNKVEEQIREELIKAKATPEQYAAYQRWFDLGEHPATRSEMDEANATLKWWQSVANDVRREAHRKAAEVVPYT